MEMETFTSVFDAITDTPAEAANIKARSELLCALKEQISPGTSRTKSPQQS